MGAEFGAVAGEVALSPAEVSRTGKVPAFTECAF